MKNLIITTGLVILLNAFSSCNSGLSGTYTDNNKKLTFTSGSKVEASSRGITNAGTYEKDGDKIIISVNGNNTVLTIDEDGCLDGGRAGKFCKVEE